MTHDTASDLGFLRTEVDKLNSLILTAHRHLEEGRLINLKALEERTGEICEAAMALSPTQAQSLLTELSTLIANLGTMAGALNDRIDTCSSPIEEKQPTATKASSAYAQTFDSTS